MINIMTILAIGLIGGLASGFFGIGGAVVMVPLLTSVLNYPQKLAQGTTLLMFMVAPSMLAGYQYYKSGNSNVKAAAILWVGVFIGSAVGAWVVNTVFKDNVVFMMVLKKSFSVVMVILAVKTWFS